MKGVNANGQGVLKLTDAELEKMAEYYYPLHAIGYNWLQSNEESGKYVAGQVKKIIAHYQKRFGSKSCSKVILLTHSMGGLVARAAIHSKMGNISDLVLGAVHNAMPALGAAATYKRMRAGFEKGPGWGKNVAVMYVLGASGKSVTAVVANSPGGLQLLPNQHYGSNWLTAQGVGQTYVIGPSGNPYTGLYREKNKWWRMVNPEWIDPAKKLGDKAWFQYLSHLDRAAKFHLELDAVYHPHTYVVYGSDSAFKAWGKITWKQSGFLWQDAFSVFDKKKTQLEIMHEGVAAGMIQTSDLDLSRAVSDDSAVARLSGRKVGGRLVFEMNDQEEPGDATVPQRSGSAPARRGGSHIKMQLTASGFEHQDSYNPAHRLVFQFMQYSIAKIAQQAK